MIAALFPYIEAPEYVLLRDVPIIHDLKLQVFGPLVAVGVVLGWKQCLKYAKHKDIDEFLFRDYLFWMLVTAFVVSHWVSVLFYFPDQVKENPAVLLYIWSGLSSVGGFFGAFIGMTWYLKKHKQPIIVYADATIFGLVLGWCFGRLGCALVHDHPGKVVPEGTFLAVGPWPDETWRYDLGLLECIFAVCLMTFIYKFSRWETRRPGWIVGLVVTAYAPFRFMLDFLRADEKARVITTPDARYAGLTTAQWFCVAFLLAGLWLMFFRKAKPDDLKYAKNSDRVAREAAEAKAAEGKGEEPKAKPKEPERDRDEDPERDAKRAGD
jgi:phosphatidylglycerol---prolipoprotein diacylglyceryl transferase